MSQGYFVTGTDTGVGKTLISAALVHLFALQGLKAVGMKPVAAGCREEHGVLISEDVEILQAASNVRLPLNVINPYAFKPPLAPHIAAKMTGRQIELSVINRAFLQARLNADVVVVEGVGGFCVPINDIQSMADVAVACDLPVILVVGMRLGCINHALLSVEAILARGLVLSGWVANCIDPEMAALTQNLDALKALIPAPCLGVIPFQGAPDYVTVSSWLEAIVVHQNKLSHSAE